MRTSAHVDFVMLEKTIEISKEKLRFHIINTNKFKISRLSFNFILPADKINSPKTKLMLSVMMRGSRSYPTISALNKRLDELYCATVSSNATSIGANHIFKISCEMISNKYRFKEDKTDILQSVADFVLDILFNPLTDERGLLCDGYIESEKKIAIDAIRAKINDQKSYASEQCKKNMLLGDPSGISVSGSEEIINSFSAEDLTENIKYFLENSIIECYYIGDGDGEAIAERVGNAFGKHLGVKSSQVCRERAFRSTNEEKEKEICEKMQIMQGRLNIGCTCDTVMSDDDYYSICLFNEIFGGASVSKLFMNVREKKSLCYYCYSSYNSANGTLMIGCGIKPENKDEALKEIRKQLRDMQDGQFSDDDIASAKKTTISGLKQVSDSPSAIEAFKFRRFLAGVCEDSQECAEKIMNVTREQIISVAKKVKIDTIYFLSGEETDTYEEAYENE